jgi:hypothetical protein
VFGRKGSVFHRKGHRGDGGGDLRQVSRPEFLAQVKAGTRARNDYSHLYLMLEEGGTIGVQWEHPGGKRLERYRIADPRPGGCPHCAILAGIETLAPVLPLDGLRAARARDGYLMLLRMGKLPCPAFATERDTSHPLARVMMSFPTAGWLADCHAADGNPHTDADCAEHRAAG